MNDFEETLEAKSDQFNASDLMGHNITVTIKSIKVSAKEQQPVTISVLEHTKFYRPSKGMRRIMADIWKTSDYSKYIGQSISLYRDPEVLYSGKAVGGICIGEATGINEVKHVTIPISRTKTKTYTIKPLVRPVTKPVEPETPKHAPPEPSETLSEARDAARGGKESFAAWWKANADKRAEANTIMDELKQLCAEGDADE